jgi:nucleoside-diphosphate-sugar epimerase
VKRALVTGGAGFVGRHMTQRLLTDGWMVQTVDLVPLDIDYLAPGDLQSFAHEHWEGDVREWFMMDSGGRWDLVVHCAANVGGRATIDGDPLWVAENLELDAAMFRWAADYRLPRVVYYSSSAAYPVELQDGRDCLDCGHRPHGPLREDDIQLDQARIGKPDNTYGWAKVTGEMLAEHARAAGVAVHVLRPFSGYGEDQGVEYPFGAFIDRAKRRADPFEIWGDGRQVRDWVHIDDVIGATLAVIEADYQEPVNVCTGRAVSMEDLAYLIVRAIQDPDYRPDLKRLTTAPNGPCVYRVGDPTRLKMIYKPQISIEQGIRRALDAG